MRKGSLTICLIVGLVSLAHAGEDPGEERLEEATVDPVMSDDDLAADAEDTGSDSSSIKLNGARDKAEAPLKVAPNVDLKEVAPAPGKKASSTTELAPEAGHFPSGQSASPSDQQGTVQGDEIMGDVRPLDQEPFGSEVPVIKTPEPMDLVLLDRAVEPGTAARLAWRPDVTFPGLAAPTPVLVVHGASAGPVLCMTAAVHGDELNGIEIVRRVLYDTDPEALSGTVIGIPIVNVHGFQRSSRYLPDRRDLNRYFPGHPDGSLASRVAHSLFREVIKHCDFLVDLHTGSLKRTNLPQLRADMHNERIAEFTRGFDEMVVVHSAGSDGMLRTAAAEAGIVAVTMEVGESLRIQEEKIQRGVDSINSLLEKEGMYSRLWVWGDPEPVYYDSHWVRADQGGILFSEVELGDRVKKGDRLGTVTDPITNEQSAIVAEADGRIIGMAVDQFVMAGFAAYHIGAQSEGPQYSE